VLFEAPRWGQVWSCVDLPHLHARLSLPCLLLMWWGALGGRRSSKPLFTGILYT